jgi:hypothetical protein
MRPFEKLTNLVDYLRFVRSIRPTDVFIVSWPKSGTTWLAFLVANLLKGSRPGQLNLRNSTRYVPDLNRGYLKKRGFTDGFLNDLPLFPDPRIFKVHAPYDKGLPKVVYLLRDPRDAIVSTWHYLRLQDATFSLSLKDFIRKDGYWPCSWDLHVGGWLLDHDHPDLLLVKYEEIHQDTYTVLRRVLDFSGIRYDGSDIAKAVETSRFDDMQRLEEKFGSVESGGVAGERFIRKGKIGGWRQELDRESLLIIEKKYIDVMESVGYKPEG